MKPRITINVTAKGDFEIWLNEAGRDQLVQELKDLTEGNDHIHVGTEGIGDLVVSSRPYRPDDKILDYGKILFRTDAWDRQYFPHVLDETA